MAVLKWLCTCRWSVPIVAVSIVIFSCIRSDRQQLIAVSDLHLPLHQFPVARRAGKGHAEIPDGQDEEPHPDVVRAERLHACLICELFTSLNLNDRIASNKPEVESKADQISFVISSPLVILISVS